MGARLLTVFFLCLTLVRIASAQDVRGTVRDSASGQVIAGVVIEVFDSAGTSIARALSSDRGQFHIRVRANAVRVDFLRLGFHPHSLTPPLAGARGNDSVTTLDVTMSVLASLVTGVRVDVNPRCPVRSDEVGARALWEQARAGLLAMVVARDQNPAAVMRVAYERNLDVIGMRTLHQTVRVESANSTTPSYFAVRSATDFLHRGFRAESNGRHTYFSPDADILLDQNFARGYCFQLVTGDSAKPQQIGLGFVPADRQRGRVDITGALWIDTTTRAIHDLEFRYVGVDETSEALGAGGRVSFRMMPNGVTVIDQWLLRLIGAPEIDSRGNAAIAQQFVVREVGGELVRASWADGTAWSASLGHARVQLLDEQGKPAAGVAVGLADTDYRAISDVRGYATFDDLAPGPYVMFVVDAQLARVGITIPTSYDFTARRGSVTVSQATIPSATEYATQACRDRGFPEARQVLLARVTTTEGRPVRDVSWRLVRNPDLRSATRVNGNETEPNGLIFLCDRVVFGESIRVEIFRGRVSQAVADVRVTDRLTLVRLIVPMTVPVLGASSNTTDTSTPVGISISGTVRDSVSGLGIANAMLTLVDTPHVSESDSVGRFAFAALQRGDYVAEIRTPRLDSLGTLKRVVISVSMLDNIFTFFTPTDDQIAVAMCGDAGISGVLVGRVESSTAAGLDTASRHVVAEWTEPRTTARGAPSAQLRRVNAAADARGTFRLCGVPLGVPIVLRAAVSGARTDGRVPTDVHLSLGRRIVRADLLLRGAPPELK